MSEQAGAWIELPLSYLVTTGRHCACCGRLLSRRGWKRADTVYCEPDCARLQQDFGLPDLSPPNRDLPGTGVRDPGKTSP